MSDVSNEWLVGVRAIHFAATLSTAGVVCFWWIVAAPAFRRAGVATVGSYHRWLERIVWAGLAAIIVSGLAWVVLLAADASGRPLSDMLTTDAVPALLGSTRFGNVTLVRLLLAGVLAAGFAVSFPDRSPSRWLVATQVLSAAALAGALAWIGHGGATEGARGYGHLIADVLHLCAAAAWLGGLLPLALVLKIARDEAGTAWADLARDTTRRFSVLGLLSVGTLVATGAVNTWFLAGTVPALLGTTYGKLLLVKIMLFMAMLCLAAVNRVRLTPLLSNPPNGTSGAIQALRALQRNSLTELGLGIVIVFIVGALGTMPPGAHTQPWWPFAFRFDASVFTHPTLLYRTQAIFAALASAAGVVCLGAAFPLRVARLPLLLVGALGVSFIPQLVRLTSVEAYPTSFYLSSTGYTVASIARGKALFAEHCAACHGPDGRGGVAVGKDGGRAPDLTSDHAYAHRDGDMFWWISNGIRDAMPGFGAVIAEEERWNLIDFLHANADAAHVRSFGADDLLSVAIPNFTCEKEKTSSQATFDLRGQVLYILFAGSPAADRVRHFAGLDLGNDITKMLVPLDPAGAWDLPVCVAREPEVPEAFAAYRGGDAAQLDGTVLIVDPAGYLRSMQRSPPPSVAELIKTTREKPALPRSAIARMHSH